MTPEEQDQILGRLIRERRETRIRLAALSAKCSQIAGDLAAAADSLKRMFDPTRTDPAVVARQAVTCLPPTAELLVVIEEIRLDNERLRELERQLAAFD